MAVMRVGARTKYGVRGSRQFKGIHHTKSNDNPSNNPNVIQRRRLGMTPPKGAGEGAVTKRQKGGKA